MPEQETSIVKLVLVCIPIYLFWGWVIFRSWSAFWEAIRYLFTPDFWSFLNFKYGEDLWAEFKLGLWFFGPIIFLQLIDL